jgi:hypothetical protein
MDNFLYYVKETFKVAFYLYVTLIVLRWVSAGSVHVPLGLRLKATAPLSMSRSEGLDDPVRSRCL